jgi:hypothetical protein
MGSGAVLAMLQAPEHQSLIRLALGALVKQPGGT